LGNAVLWRTASTEFAAEKTVLRLDCWLAKEVLGWSPRLDLKDALDWTAQWYAYFAEVSDPLNLVRSQIDRYTRVVEPDAPRRRRPAELRCYCLFAAQAASARISASAAAWSP
jgi:hypothetical protein